MQTKNVLNSVSLGSVQLEPPQFLLLFKLNVLLTKNYFIGTSYPSEPSADSSFHEAETLSIPDSPHSPLETQNYI